MIDSGLIVSILRASLIAIFPLGLWAVGRFGTSKVWYFQTSVTSMVFGLARFWYYVLPFLGLMFLFGGVDNYYLGLNPNSGSIWFYVGMACIPIGFVCGFWQPDWLSPAWLRRLKQQCENVIPLLIEDAVGMDKKTLQSKTETWEHLEAWVDEVQQKHRLER